MPRAVEERTLCAVAVLERFTGSHGGPWVGPRPALDRPTPLERPRLWLRSVVQLACEARRPGLGSSVRSWSPSRSLPGVGEGAR